MYVFAKKFNINIILIYVQKDFFLLIMLNIHFYFRELNVMRGTQETFKNILELSKTALFLKQQIKYLESKKYVYFHLKKYIFFLRNIYYFNFDFMVLFSL